jgi:hypothetical protein
LTARTKVDARISGMWRTHFSLANYVYAEGRFTDETPMAPRAVVLQKFKGNCSYSQSGASHRARFP